MPKALARKTDKSSDQILHAFPRSRRISGSDPEPRRPEAATSRGQSCLRPASARRLGLRARSAIESAPTSRASVIQRTRSARPMDIPGAPHPLPLDRILRGLVEAGGVEEVDRITPEIEVHFDDVPRRARVGRHNGGLASGETIEQVDLPAFGGPAIATQRPSLSRSPRPRSRQRLGDFRFDFPHDRSRPGNELLGHIALVGEIDPRLNQGQGLDQLFRHASARPPRRPLIWPSAWRLCASVSAPTKSARPSTAVRSSRPASKARRVNSPGSARRNPGSSPRALSTAAMTALPPWIWSSAESSPVSLLGPGNQSASASSRRTPDAGSWILANAARRGSGTRPTSCSSARRAAGPETLITAMAAGGALKTAQRSCRSEAPANSVSFPDVQIEKRSTQQRSAIGLSGLGPNAAACAGLLSRLPITASCRPRARAPRRWPGRERTSRMALLPFLYYTCAMKMLTVRLPDALWPRSRPRRAGARSRNPMWCGSASPARRQAQRRRARPDRRPGRLDRRAAERPEREPEIRPWPQA